MGQAIVIKAGGKETNKQLIIDYWLLIIFSRLLEKKYLKTIFNCHQCDGTLDAGNVGRDGWETLTITENRTTIGS